MLGCEHLQRRPHPGYRLLQPLLYQRRWQTQHRVPRPHELAVPQGVGGNTPSVQRISINLHDEPCFAREQVDDVPPDDLLPPKLHPEALPTKGREEERFRVSGMVPHEACPLAQELFA